MTKRDKVMRASREVTGTRVGKIAGRVLQRLKELKIPTNTPLYVVTSGGEVLHVCWLHDLEALAGTSLTQRPTGKPIEATARPKKAGRVGRK